MSLFKRIVLKRYKKSEEGKNILKYVTFSLRKKNGIKTQLSLNCNVINVPIKMLPFVTEKGGNLLEICSLQVNLFSNFMFNSM